MGGFAALLGGIGGPAQLYGNQVRGFLEQRREGIMGQLIQEAGRTWDPEHRSNLLQGAADLASGKPMDKALNPVIKSFQTHEQGTQWHGQLAQAVQQAMPQPGPPQPGPPAVGQPPGTTLPADITAALPPLSPVSPEAQGPGPQAAPFSQGLAPNSPLAPPAGEASPLTAAIGQPTAAPPAGPIPQAGPQTEPLGSAYDPFQFPERALSFLRDLPPGAREGMQPYMAQAAARAEQLGMLQTEMGWKQRVLPELLKQVDQQLQDPNTPDWYRAVLGPYRTAAMAWAATPGGNLPAFPMNMGALMRTQEPVYHIEDATRMSPADKQARGIPAEVEGPVIMGLPRLGGGPGLYYGQAPAHYQQGWTLDQNFNPLPVSFSPQTPSQPAQPMAGVPGGGPLQPPGYIRPVQGTMDTGQIGTTSPAEMRAGVGPRPSGFVNPLTFPSYSFTPVAQEGPGGTEIVKPMPIIRGKIFGGTGPGIGGRGGPTGGGIPAGPNWTVTKPVTPQRLDMDRAQIGQMNQAIDLAQDIINKAPVLNSLLSSHKIEWALEGQGILNAKVAQNFPGAGMLSRSLTRAVQYTPEELDVLNDFNSLRESVNILRNALGGGFRGTEAFNTLQNLRGDILQNPEITKSLLRNLIREIQIQAGPLGTRTQIPVHGAQITPKGELMGGQPQAMPAAQGAPADLDKANALADQILSGRRKQ